MVASDNRRMGCHRAPTNAQARSPSSRDCAVAGRVPEVPTAEVSHSSTLDQSVLQLRVTNGFPTRFLVPTLQQELPYRQPHRVQRLRHHKLKEPFRDVLIYLVDRECDTLGCRDSRA
jgi:hypothetical protein